LARSACVAGTLEEQLSTTGQVNHSILIREHAGWNKDCEAIAHPALYLDQPPRHGSVCARIQNIKIQTMYVGTAPQCVGRMVRGVQLIYRPDAGYAGDDGLRYAARYPTVLRSVSVSVTVAADSGAPSATPSNVTTPWEPSRQLPGEVPACEELLF
jgi:hypothetical protein